MIWCAKENIQRLMLPNVAIEGSSADGGVDCTHVKDTRAVGFGQEISH